MPSSLNESTVELATLDWLAALGYGVLHGPGIGLEETFDVRLRNTGDKHTQRRLES